MDLLDIFYGNLLTISFLVGMYFAYRFMQYLYRQICWLYGCYQDYKKLCMIKNICCGIVDFMPTLIFSILYGYIINRCINSYNNKSIMSYLLDYFMGNNKQPTSTCSINFNELMKSLGPLNCLNDGKINVMGATGPSGKPIGKTICKPSSKTSGITGVTGPNGPTSVMGVTGAIGPTSVTGVTGATSATSATSVMGATGSCGSHMNRSYTNEPVSSSISTSKLNDYASPLQSIMSPLNVFLDSLQKATNPTGIGSINGANGVSNGISNIPNIANTTNKATVMTSAESNADTSL